MGRAHPEGGPRERGRDVPEADATSSAEQQTSDIESLVSRGARVLIVVAQDGTAVKPAVADAIKRGVQVIAYDRLIDDPKTLYVSFDNVEVGRMQARAVLAAKPAGNYAFIKGDRGDANADFLRAGQEEIIGPALKSGAIRNVGETYTDNWNAPTARMAMEQILTDSKGKVDAVLAENDGLAEGVINALADHRLAGKVALSGEDGDMVGLKKSPSARSWSTSGRTSGCSPRQPATRRPSCATVSRSTRSAG